MGVKQGKTCPVCFKEHLFYLRDHLRQVHKLSRKDRKRRLKTATYTPTQPSSCEVSSELRRVIQTTPVKRVNRPIKKQAIAQRQAKTRGSLTKRAKTSQSIINRPQKESFNRTIRDERSYSEEESGFHSQDEQLNWDDQSYANETSDSDEDYADYTEAEIARLQQSRSMAAKRLEREGKQEPQGWTALKLPIDCTIPINVNAIVKHSPIS